MQHAHGVRVQYACIVTWTRAARSMVVEWVAVVVHVSVVRVLCAWLLTECQGAGLCTQPLLLLSMATRCATRRPIMHVARAMAAWNGPSGGSWLCPTPPGGAGKALAFTEMQRACER